jgi:hypothetical protein
MSILETYRAHCAGVTAMAAHLPRLRGLATGCEMAVEFGVKHGGSSSALLLGAKWVRSYDIVETPRARLLETIAPHWEYVIGDSRTAEVLETDLLLVDSLHTYGQCRAELERHADAVRRWLIFHDTLTFGSIGADGETGRQLWTYESHVSVPPAALGIRPAIDELMIRDPSWRVAASYTDSHGLLVLERRAA